MKQKRWTAILLAVSLAAAMTGCAPRVESCPAADQTQPGAAYETLAEATYPEMAKYPDETAYMKKDGSFDDEGFSKVYDAWWADKRARRDIDIDRENVQSFVRASTGADAGERKWRQFRLFALERVHGALDAGRVYGRRFPDADIKPSQGE